MTKPTIVLAPGAWHASIHYTRLTVFLETAGYPVVCRTLPSFNGDNSKPYRDTAFIRDELIMPLLREGKDVVIMAHSFGGYPAGEASYGLSKQERMGKGEKGGVIGFIWISAMLVKEGPSFKDRFPGGVWPSRFIVNESVGNFVMADAKEQFYSDVSEADAEAAFSETRPLACNTHYSVIGPPGWAESALDGRRVFLLCTEDRGVPPAWQRSLMEESGVEWRVVELKSGHSPFLSIPKETAEAVIGAVDGFRRADELVASKQT